jgi:hypothetical protein
MKCETTNAILTFMLGVLAVAGAILVLRTVIQTRELQRSSPQATVENGYLTQAQMLVNDVAAYNQKKPSQELTKLLQSLQSKPVKAK